MKELDLEEMFAAGARSVAKENGLSEKDSESFAELLCKEARPRFRVVDDDDDDDDTWWSRNKGWVLPAGVGLGAFLLGADAARGRPDRSLYSNVAGNMWKRVKALLGLNMSPLERAVTVADPEVLKMVNSAAESKAEASANPPDYKSTGQ